MRKLITFYFPPSTLLLSLLFLFACTTSTKNYPLPASELHQLNIKLEEAIVSDFFTPPVAGRIYSYPNIAAYEVLAQTDPNYKSLSSSIQHLKPIPKATETEMASIDISAAIAFYKVAEKLVYSSVILDEYMNTWLSEQKTKLGESQLSIAENYGNKVADHILTWTNADNYKETRTFREFVLTDTSGSWAPTRPDYLEALEPHWNKIRPFTLKSADQFHPGKPTKFSTDKNSAFFAELEAVYDAEQKRNENEDAIAKFWDCNPNVPKHHGHLIINEKKLTPGGHWINIARIAARKEKKSLIKTAQTYALVSIAISDAFISCWDTKYKTNYIRPVTAINRLINPDWIPTIYTPNFPEFTSGHSVVSGSAATILSHLYGENFAFIDSTEVPYGMPPRAFNSFFEASEEAAISRFYGGIHFTPAIELGKTQGRNVGKHVLNTFKKN